MIKFFRKIRQRLLSENRLGSYLVYAIGEIILVVIGILIAISINNWNQQRINTSKSLELLQGISNDLLRDSEYLENIIKSYQSRVDFYERHLTDDDYSNTPMDTLLAIMESQSSVFKISDQTFQKVKNLGISKISDDDSLSFILEDYYTKLHDFTASIIEFEMEESLKDYHFWTREQQVIEFTFDSLSVIPVLQDSVERQQRTAELLQSVGARNILKYDAARKAHMLQHFTHLLESAQVLREDIANYLKQKRE